MAALPFEQTEDLDDADSKKVSGEPSFKLVAVKDEWFFNRYLDRVKQILTEPPSRSYRIHLLEFSSQGLEKIVSACRKVSKAEVELHRQPVFLSCPKYCLILLLYQKARAPPQFSFPFSFDISSPHPVLLPFFFDYRAVLIRIG